MRNRITLQGNVGQEPTVRQTTNNKKVATFGLATEENYKDQKGEWQSVTDWHRCVAWGKQADLIEQHVDKGTPLIVEGKMKYRKYTGKDGVERQSAEVVVGTVHLLKKLGKLEAVPAGVDSKDDDMPF